MKPSIALYGGPLACNRGNGTLPLKADLWADPFWQTWKPTLPAKQTGGTIAPPVVICPASAAQVLLAVPAVGNCLANSFSSPAASSLAWSIQRSRAMRPSKFITSSIRLMSAAVQAAIWA